MRIASLVVLAVLGLARMVGAQTCNLNGFGADELLLTVPATVDGPCKDALLAAIAAVRAEIANL